MDIEKINNRVQSIKDDLNNLSNAILSKAERQKKLDEIQEKARQTKEQIEQEISTLYNTGKEKKEALLNSLHEITNLELSLKCNNSNESTGNEEPGIFTKTKNWIGEQRSDIRDTEKRNQERGQNLLRSVGFAATGVGAIALLCKGIKRLFKRKEKKDETKDEQQEKKSFWQRPFGRFLKWLGISSITGYGLRKLGKHFNRGNDTEEENFDENTPEGQLHGYENRCNALKNQAENCRRLASAYVTDFENNAREYENILEEALMIQRKAINSYNDVFNSPTATNEIKDEARRRKENIDNIVNEISSMKAEIYQNVPTENYNPQHNNSNENGNNQHESGETEQENFQPIDANVFSTAAIDYLRTSVPDLPLNDTTKNEIKTILNNYFRSNPMLKISDNKNMIFEIKDKTAFSTMLKQLRRQIMGGMNGAQRAGARLLYGETIKDIEDTINDIEGKLNTLTSNEYENIVFNCLGGIVKDVVRHENGTMTVQSYYDNIKSCYPNINETQIDDDLKNSGQADKDIKEMDTSRITPTA